MNEKDEYIKRLLEDLRNDPQLQSRLGAAIKAHAEGRAKPWAQVKQELGIQEISENTERIKQLAALEMEISTESKDWIPCPLGRSMRGATTCRECDDAWPGTHSIHPMIVSTVPLIRTADGRTLRVKCEGCQGCLPDRSYRQNDCNGIGWLPVSEAEAALVCLQWIGENGGVTFISRDTVSIEVMIGWLCLTQAVIHDHDVAGALFEAIGRVIKWGKERHDT